MAKQRPTFSSDFKRFFFRGLAVLLPSVLTLWLLVHAYLFVERQVADPINRAIRQGVLWVIPRTVPEKKLPEWFVVTDEKVRLYRQTLQQQPQTRALANRPEAELRAILRADQLRQFWDSQWYFRFIGLVVAIVLIYLAGLLLGGFIGRSVYEQFERFMTRIPVFKQVYPHVKQLVDMVLGERSMAFKKVVFIEYPRKGIWTLCFVTGSGFRGASDVARGDVITVFVPSTPTPFTGFTLTVRRDETFDVPLSVDEAIRFVLTGGVLTPNPQLGEGRPVIDAEAMIAEARRGAAPGEEGPALPSTGEGRDGGAAKPMSGAPGGPRSG